MIVKCSLCKRFYQGQSNFLSHFQAKHAFRMLTQSEKQIVHTKTFSVSSGPPKGNCYDCNICGKHISCPNSLIAHIVTHIGAITHYCKLCYFSTISEFHLMKHMAGRHAGSAVAPLPPECYQCDMCSSFFNTLLELTEHYIEHLQKMRFSCGYCKLLFEKEIDFNVHSHLHSEAVFCFLCHQIFNSRIKLLSHVLTHRKSKLFPKFYFKNVKMQILDILPHHSSSWCKETDQLGPSDITSNAECLQNSRRNSPLFGNGKKNASNGDQCDIKKNAGRPECFSVDNYVDSLQKEIHAIESNCSFSPSDAAPSTSSAIDTEILQKKRNAGESNSTSLVSDRKLKTSDTSESDIESCMKEQIVCLKRSSPVLRDLVNADSISKSNGFKVSRWTVKTEPEIQKDIDYLCEVVMEGKSLDLEHFMSDFPLSQRKTYDINNTTTHTNFWNPADPEDHVETSVKESDIVKKNDNQTFKKTVQVNSISSNSNLCDSLHTESEQDSGFSLHNKTISQKGIPQHLSHYPVTCSSTCEDTRNPRVELLPPDISNSDSQRCNLNVKKCLILDDKQQIQLMVSNDSFLDSAATIIDQTSVNDIMAFNTKKFNGIHHRSFLASKHKKTAAKNQKKFNYVNNSSKGLNTKGLNETHKNRQTVLENYFQRVKPAYLKSHRPDTRRRDKFGINSCMSAQKGTKSLRPDLHSEAQFTSEMHKAKSDSVASQQSNTRFRQLRSKSQPEMCEASPGCNESKLTDVKELSIELHKLPNNMLSMQSHGRVQKKAKFRRNRQSKFKKKFTESRPPCLKHKSHSRIDIYRASPRSIESKRSCLRARSLSRIGTCKAASDSSESQRPFLRSRAQSRIKMCEVKSQWPDLKELSVVLYRLPSYVLDMRSYRRYCREQNVAKLKSNQQLESRKISDTFSRKKLAHGFEDMMINSSPCQTNLLPEQQGFQISNDDLKRNPSIFFNENCFNSLPTVEQTCEIVASENTSNQTALNINATGRLLPSNKKCSKLSTNNFKKLSKTKHSSFSDRTVKKVVASTKKPSSSFITIGKSKKLPSSSIMPSHALRLATSKFSLPQDHLKGNEIVNVEKKLRSSKLMVDRKECKDIFNSDSKSLSAQHHQTIKDAKNNMHSCEEKSNGYLDEINCDKELLSQSSELVDVSKLESKREKIKRIVPNKAANSKNFSKKNVVRNMSSESEATDTASPNAMYFSADESWPSFSFSLCDSFVDLYETQAKSVSVSSELAKVTGKSDQPQNLWVLPSNPSFDTSSPKSVDTSDDILLSNASISLSNTNKVSSDKISIDSSSRFCDRSVIKKSPGGSPISQNCATVGTTKKTKSNSRSTKMANGSVEKSTEMKTLSNIGKILERDEVKKSAHSSPEESPKKIKNILFRKKRVACRPHQNSIKSNQERKLCSPKKSKQSKTPTKSVKKISANSLQHLRKSKNYSNYLSTNQKLMVQLHKLPESIYEKHNKGKPIMLANLLPVVENVRSLHKELPTEANPILNEHSYCLSEVDVQTQYSFLEHNYSLYSRYLA